MRLFLAFLLAVTLLPFGVSAASVPGSWDNGSGPPPITYPVIGANNVYAEQLGDGSNAHGGLPPVFSSQLADIPSTVTTQVLEGAGQGSTTGTNEAKFRFTLFGSHVLPDDPLRNHCSRGASHLHEFMGSDKSGACTIFSQLRNDAIADFAAGLRATTNPGKDVNASAYWHPTVIDRNPLGDGVDRIKKVLLVPLYYEVNADACAGGVNSCLVTEASSYVDFPMGFGYVSGKNMDDPWNLRMSNAITAANAANVAAGGPSAAYEFSPGEGPSGDGLIGWTCLVGATATARSSGPTIDDLDCLAGDTLIVEAHGAGCWWGRSLYSPSGYDHVIPQIKVTAKDVAGGAFVIHTDVCPVGWYKIPQLIDKPQWVLSQNISSSVSNDSPYLSSDAAFQTKARTFAGHETFVCKAGCSFHFDYMQAWSKKYLRRAFRHCLGVPWTDTSETGLDADQTPVVTACNGNTLSDDGATESSLVQISFPARSDVNGDAISDFYPMPVPKGHMGPATMPMSMNDNMPMPANDNQTKLAGAAPVSFDLRRVGR